MPWATVDLPPFSIVPCQQASTIPAFERHAALSRGGQSADCMLSDSRFSSRSDACLSVAAAGFQYYVDQRLPEFRIGPATAETLRNLIDDDPAPPVLWLLTARDLDPGEEFKRMLNDHYVGTDQVKFLKTSLERWERPCRP